MSSRPGTSASTSGNNTPAESKSGKISADVAARAFRVKKPTSATPSQVRSLCSSAEGWKPPVGIRPGHSLFDEYPVTRDIPPFNWPGTRSSVLGDISVHTLHTSIHALRHWNSRNPANEMHSLDEQEQRAQTAQSALQSASHSQHQLPSLTAGSASSLQRRANESRSASACRAVSSSSQDGDRNNKEKMQLAIEKHKQRHLRNLLSALPDAIKKLKKSCPGPAATVASELLGAARSLPRAAERVATAELQHWITDALPGETQQEFVEPLRELMAQVARDTEDMQTEATAHEQWRRETAAQVRSEVLPLAAAVNRTVERLKNESNQQLQLVRSRFNFSHKRHSELGSHAVRVQGMRDDLRELTARRSELDRDIASLNNQIQRFPESYGTETKPFKKLRQQHDTALEALEAAKAHLNETLERDVSSVQEISDTEKEIESLKQQLSDAKTFLELERKRLETASPESFCEIGRHGRMTPRPDTVAQSQTQDAFRSAVSGFLTSTAMQRLRGSSSNTTAKRSFVVPEPFLPVDLRRVEEIPEDEMAVADGTAADSTTLQFEERLRQEQRRAATATSSAVASAKQQQIKQQQLMRKSLFTPWRKASTDNVLRLQAATLCALQDLLAWQGSELQRARERSGTFLRPPVAAAASSSSAQASTNIAAIFAPSPSTASHLVSATGEFVQICPVLGTAGPSALSFFASVGSRVVADSSSIDLAGGGISRTTTQQHGSSSPHHHRIRHNSPHRHGGTRGGGAADGTALDEHDNPALVLFRPSLPTPLELSSQLLEKYLDLLCEAVDSFRRANLGLFSSWPVAVPSIVRYIAWSSNAARNAAVPISSTAAAVSAAAAMTLTQSASMQSFGRGASALHLMSSVSRQESRDGHHQQQQQTGEEYQQQQQQNNDNNNEEQSAATTPTHRATALGEAATAKRLMHPLEESAADNAHVFFADDDQRGISSTADELLLPSVDEWPAWFIESLPRAHTTAHGPVSLRHTPSLFVKQAVLSGTLPFSILRQHADAVRVLRRACEAEAKDCELIATGATRLSDTLFRAAAARCLRKTFLELHLPLQALPAVAACLPRRLAVSPGDAVASVSPALFRVMHFVQVRLAAILLKRLGENAVEIVPAASGSGGGAYAGVASRVFATAATSPSSSSRRSSPTLFGSGGAAGLPALQHSTYFISASKLRKALESAPPISVAQLHCLGLAPANGSQRCPNFANDEESAAMEGQLTLLLRLALQLAQSARAQQRRGARASSNNSPRRTQQQQQAGEGEQHELTNNQNNNSAGAKSSATTTVKCWLWRGELLGDRILDGLTVLTADELQEVMRERIAKKGSPKRANNSPHLQHAAAARRNNNATPPPTLSTNAASEEAAAAVALSSSTAAAREAKLPKLPAAVAAINDWVDALTVFRRVAQDLLLVEFVHAPR